MSLSNAALDLQQGLAEAYDTLAGEFQSGVAVRLLRVDALDEAFEDLLTISASRFWEYSNFRKNTLLEIAIDGAFEPDGITTTTMTEYMAFATHVQIGSDVYIIRQGDTLSPSGTNPVWQLFLDLFETDQQYSQL